MVDITNYRENFEFSTSKIAFNCVEFCENNSIRYLIVNYFNILTGMFD